MSLRHIPVGSIIHNVEMKPGRGGQLARSAGGSVSFTAREGIYAYLRLKSGETRKVHIDCRATIGEVGNDEHNLRSYGKAGAKRWRGMRPTVRGLAMNPVDHPHGGGEGKSGQGNPHPVSPVGLEHQGTEDPPQQAHGQHDRPAPQEPHPLTWSTDMPRSLKKGPFVDLHLAKKVQTAVGQERSQARSRPGRAARWSCRKWWA